MIGLGGDERGGRRGVYARGGRGGAGGGGELRPGAREMLEEFAAYLRENGLRARI